MPFIPQSERHDPDLNTPGGKCYREYRHIIERWTAHPRWFTVDELAIRLYPDEYDRAYFLAFCVFFAEHAMPYERAKKAINGDIQ